MLDYGVAVLQAGDDRRQHEVAGAVDAGATGLDGAAGRLGLGDGIEELLHGAVAVQRAHQVGGIGRVADLAFHLLVGLDQGGQHVGVDRAVHDQAAGGGAALAGGTDGAEHDARHGQLQVGGFVQDDGVIATQFQQAAAEAACDLFVDGAADLGRAGEADQRHATVIDHLLRQRGAGIVDQEEDVRETGFAQGVVADLQRGDGGQRRLVGRLPDADVATDGRQERVPAPHCHREVEGRDDADQAQRVVLLVHAVAGALGMHGVAVQHAALAHGEIGDVDHLLHFAIAFRLALAHFQGNQRTQGVLVLAQCFAAQAHGFAAARGRRGAPDLEGFLGAGDDGLVLGLGGRADLRDRLAGGRVDRGDQLTTGRARPLPVAQVRASVDRVQAKGLEQLGRHADSCVSLRCLAPSRAGGGRDEQNRRW